MSLLSEDMPGLIVVVKSGYRRNRPNRCCCVVMLIVVWRVTLSGLLVVVM